MFTNTLDTTVGGETSNSYVTLEEALSYVQYRSDADSFKALSPEEQSSRLIYAATINDLLLSPVGIVASDTQSMLFPRKKLIDKNGKAYPDNVIPTPIKYAQVEQALYLTNNSIKPPSVLGQGFSSVRLDVMSIELDKSFIPSKVDSDAVNFLQLFGKVTSGTGFNIVDIVRY